MWGAVVRVAHSGCLVGLLVGLVLKVCWGCVSVGWSCDLAGVTGCPTRYGEGGRVLGHL